jgi:hypothetical protein
LLTLSSNVDEGKPLPAARSTQLRTASRCAPKSAAMLERRKLDSKANLKQI